MVHEYMLYVAFVVSKTGLQHSKRDASKNVLTPTVSENFEIIITILQLSPNNSIVDNTFVLYKHILKSTILIHVVSKNHQATNRLLQNQPQNELSPRALHVPEI